MARSLETVLNESNQSKVASAQQLAVLGSLLKLSGAFVLGTVSGNVLVLPENQKAAALLGGYRVAGTATGAVTPVVAAPASAGEAQVTPSGDILFLAADAVTEAEIVYMPVDGVLVEDTVNVTANLGTLLASRGALLLLEVEVTAGTGLGPKTVVARGTAPAAGEAAIDDAGTGVAFNAADAVTQARVKYIATPGVGATRDALVGNLESDSNL